MIKKIVYCAITLLFVVSSQIPLSEAYDVIAVKSAEISPYNQALEGFKDSCGCSITEIAYQDMADSDLLIRIRKEGPDMVLAIGMDALRHVQPLTDIPIVYAMVPHSPRAASAQKNISGVSMFIPPAKQLDTISGIFPNARRIGIIYDPKNTEMVIREALRAAQAGAVELVVRKANRPGDVPALIDSLKDKIDVFWMLPDTTVVSSETINHLLLFSFQNKVPVFTFTNKYVAMGAVASLNIIPYDLGRQAGEMGRRLISDKTSNSPVRVDARNTELTINKKVAKKLGIAIRDEILGRANDVN